MSEMICLVCFILPLIFVSYFMIKTKRGYYVFFLLFTLIGYVSVTHQIQPTFVEQAESSLEIAGEYLVKDTGKTKKGYEKLTLTGTYTDERGKTEKINIYGIQMDEEIFSVGDVLSITGEVLPFDTPTQPGGYNEKMYLTTRGFDGKMFLHGAKKVGEVRTPAVLLAHTKERIYTVLREILPVEESAIMKAMITGDRDDIEEMTEDMYRKAGITHILCVSGLHISLLVLYVKCFIEKICKRSIRTTAIFTIISSLGILLFMGFSPSTVRAVVMILVAMAGKVIYRRTDWLNNIAIAALVILLIQPLYLWDAGFQLSFLTTLGIYTGSRLMGEAESKMGKLLRYAGVSFFASIFSFPVAAYHFFYISPAGILANPLIVPLSSLLLGFGILAAVLGLFCMPAAVFTAGSVYFILQIYEKICMFLGNLSFGYILVGKPSLVQVLLLYGLLFGICLYRPKKKERFALCFCAVLLLGTMVGNKIGKRENTVAFLDVGQGDCAVITTADKKAFVIDGGGMPQVELGDNIGVRVLEPYLESLGIGRVNGVFLSHPDYDHMTGLLELMNDMPVDALYVPDYPLTAEDWGNTLLEIVEKNKISLYTVKMGDEGGTETIGKFRCLYPMEKMYLSTDTNAASMVFTYTYGGKTILFTGDLEKEQENLLLRRKMNLVCDILKVSHHGSSGASSEEFLQTIHADYGIISCGRKNFYGHPHKETQKRLEDAEMEVIRTDEKGSIFVTITASGHMEIEGYRERKPIYERIEEAMETRAIP